MAPLLVGLLADMAVERPDRALAYSPGVADWLRSPTGCCPRGEFPAGPPEPLGARTGPEVGMELMLQEDRT